MARLFDDASSQYLYYAGAIITDYPFSMSAWIKTDDLATAQAAIALGSTSANNMMCRGTFRGDTSDACALRTTNGGTNDEFYNNLHDLVSGTWVLMTMVYASATSRALYVGTDKATDTDPSVTFPTLDRCSIGRIFRGADSALYWSGDICEVGLWNVALGDADVAHLYTDKWAPSKIPTGLVAYWPLFGDDSPEPDSVASYDMTLSGSPTKSTHVPDMVYPDSGLSIPIAMRYYRARSAL